MHNLIRIKRFFWLPLFALGCSLAAQAAELSVSVSTSPSQATVNEALTYTVTLLAVPTAGSTTLNDVALNYGVPPAFKLVSAETDTGACTTDPIVQCAIGEVTSTPVSVKIVLIPQQTGTISSNLITTGTKLDDATGDPSTTTANTPLTTVVVKQAPIQVDFNPAEYNVVENQGLVTLTVTRTGQSERAVSVNYATRDGTATAGQDYQAISGTLSWEEGDTDPKTLTVVVIDDGAVENEETFTLTLDKPVGATVGAASAVVTMTDNETAGKVGFSSASYQVYEGDGRTEITVTRDDGGDGPLVVNFATSTGSAVAGQDYVAASGALTWADQDITPKSFFVTILPDNTIEGEETVRLVLSAANQSILGQRSAVLTIYDEITTERAVEALTNVAQNPVQRELATAIGTLCQSGKAGADLQARCRELIVNAGRDPSGVSNALQQIAPEEYAAAGRLAVEFSARQVRNIHTRLMALRSGATGGLKLDDLKIDVQGTPIPKLGLEGAPSPDELGAPVPGQLPPGMLPPGVAHKYGLYKLGGFINGSISLGDRDTTSREAGYEFQTMGLTGGVDYRFSDNLALGLALGYGSSGTDFYNGGGDMDSESLSLALYGTYYVPDEYFVDAIYSYGQNDYTLNRNIRYSVADTQVNQTAKSSPGGDQMFFSLSGGRDFIFEELTLTPTARLDYIKASIDPFRESLSNPSAAGHQLGLDIGAMDARSLNLAIGGRAAYQIKTGSMTLIPEASLEWIAEFDTGARSINGRFIHDAGSYRFQLTGDEQDSQYFSLGLGLSLQYEGGQSAFIRYETVMGLNSASLSSIMAGFRLEF